MSRTRVLVGSFLALVASVGLGADTRSSAANLTAEQVIEKNLAARGGLQEWRAVQTPSMRGKGDAGGDAPPTHLGGRGKNARGAPPQRPTGQGEVAFCLGMKRGGAGPF